jgi:hypothetical protein
LFKVASFIAPNRLPGAAIGVLSRVRVGQQGGYKPAGAVLKAHSQQSQQWHQVLWKISPNAVAAGRRWTQDVFAISNWVAPVFSDQRFREFADANFSVMMGNVLKAAEDGRWRCRRRQAAGPNNSTIPFQVRSGVGWPSRRLSGCRSTAVINVYIMYVYHDISTYEMEIR